MKIKNKKIVIFLVLLLVTSIFLLFLLIKYKKKETETFLDEKIKLYDWWGYDEEDNNFLNTLFSKMKNRYDKINVYSVFGETEVVKKPNELNVQISGETVYRESTLFDINLIPASEKTSKNIIIHPHSALFTLRRNIDFDKLIKPRKLLTKQDKFCLFVVSNCHNEQRKKMFSELSKYKLVDSCGKCMNNMERSCPGSYHGSEEYCEFIKEYKFMICFENTSQTNYFTEKLINAYICGTIPIYWGCKNIEDYINMDSILYLPPDYTENDMKLLIEKIIYLDNNDDAYREMYEKYLLKDGKIHDCFDIEKIQQKMENCLE